jgi:hypothetical protein
MSWVSGRWIAVDVVPGAPGARRPRILVSAPPGYAVRLPDEAVDAWRFESLLTAARKEAPGQPERARQALALWRGPAYAPSSPTGNGHGRGRSGG